jgi:hypothetical protein
VKRKRYAQELIEYVTAEHYWQIHQEAQDRIEEQRRLAEEERERHMRDVNEKTRQWEAALKEREQERQVSSATDTCSQTYAYRLIGNSHMARATGSTTKEECR